MKTHICDLLLSTSDLSPKMSKLLTDKIAEITLIVTILKINTLMI